MMQTMILTKTQKKFHRLVKEAPIKFTKKKQTFPALKTVTESLRKFGWIKGKNSKGQAIVPLQAWVPKSLILSVSVRLIFFDPSINYF